MFSYAIKQQSSAKHLTTNLQEIWQWVVFFAL